MSDRSDKLRKDLDSLMNEWLFGDEGRVFIRPTKADHALVLELVREMPVKDIQQSVALLMAEAVAERIQSKGKRPADYWRSTELVEAVFEKLKDALKGSPEVFDSTLQATLKGIG